MLFPFVFSRRNMTRPMTMWYGKERPQFEKLSSDYSQVEMVTIPGGSVYIARKSMIRSFLSFTFEKLGSFLNFLIGLRKS